MSNEPCHSWFVYFSLSFTLIIWQRCHETFLCLFVYIFHATNHICFKFNFSLFAFAKRTYSFKCAREKSRSHAAAIWQVSRHAWCISASLYVLRFPGKSKITKTKHNEKCSCGFIRQMFYAFVLFSRQFPATNFLFVLLSRFLFKCS